MKKTEIINRMAGRKGECGVTGCKGRMLQKAECTQLRQMLMRDQLGIERLPDLQLRMTGGLTEAGNTGDEVGAETRLQWIEDSAGGEEVEVANSHFEFNRLGLKG